MSKRKENVRDLDQLLFWRANDFVRVGAVPSLTSLQRLVDSGRWPPPTGKLGQQRYWKRSVARAVIKVIEEGKEWREAQAA